MAVVTAVCGAIGAAAAIYGMVKTYDDLKDGSRKRWLDLHEKANISSAISQEEREQYIEQRKSILDKYPDKDKIPEGDMWELARIEAHLNGNKCDIKEQTKLAVENIKNVEMRQNVFDEKLNHFDHRLTNVENTVQRHGEIIMNHENRIGRLESKVDLHSMQISQLQVQMANHENRIGKLEVTVDQHTRQNPEHPAPPC